MKINGRMIRCSFVVIVSLALLSGCGDNPVGGDDPGNQTPPPDDSLPSENLSFSDHILPIFNSRCVSCHGGESGVTLNNHANVMASVGAQYQKNVVIAGEPAESPLVDKISSNSPEFGARMPQGGPILSSDRIQAIRTWIDEGAQNN